MEHAALLKMMTMPFPMPHAKTKKERDVEDFEAEMEMELTRRANLIEAVGGVEHQNSLSRSSSSSSLNAVSDTNSSTISQPGSNRKTKSAFKKVTPKENEDAKKGKKRVRFAENNETKLNTRRKGGMENVYDNIYFDSDNEAEETGSGHGSRVLLSDDELFYDPGSDDKDQAWVDKQRNNYFAKVGSRGDAAISDGASSDDAQRQKPLPNSDAVLNCPACFTLLCLDCQRHEFYHGQYRAMFVMNCVTNKSENRYVPSKSERYRNRKRKQVGDTQTHSSSSATIPSFQTERSDTFYPVSCKICSTEVGVFDSEEVYHFFNVLTSHS